MKKIILFFVVSILIAGCAGMGMNRSYLEPDEGHYEFIEETSKTKEEAYLLTIEWFSENAVNAQKIFQLKDEENGKIIVKPIFNLPVGMGTTMPVSYTLKIDFKDQKIRFIFDLGTYSSGMYPDKGKDPIIKEHFEFIKDDIIEHINSEQDKDW